MKKLLLHILLCSLGIACQQAGPGVELPDAELYFPTTEEWQRHSSYLEQSKTKDLRKFLEENNTRAFIILKDGKILMEEYFNKDLLGAEYGEKSVWYWASAGKTLTAFTVGLAQENGFLDINQKTSAYLGKSWTALTEDKESLITVKHQLTMTTGLDVSVSDSHCFEPSCLQYKADAGTRWEYHNGPYTILDHVISAATQSDFDNYFNQNLRDKIGMDGFWRYVNNDHVYFSTARAMARFGLLMLNKGDWQGEEIMRDKGYFNDMVNTSQNLNEAYGYLWWLNGKSTGMVPTLQTVFKRELTPNGPGDMFSGMGKNGQLVSVIPSEGLVIVRMGDSPDSSQISIDFMNEMFGKIGEIIAFGGGGD